MGEGLGAVNVTRKLKLREIPLKSAITVSLVSQSRGGPFVLWDDLAAGMDLAKALGFDGIEIFAPGPEFFVEYKDSSNNNVLSMARERGLEIAAIGTGAGWVKHRLSMADPDSSVRKSAMEFLAKMLRAASELHAPMIIGSMQGRSSPGVSSDQARGWLREGLSSLDAMASKLGAEILYEPLNRYETDQATTLAGGLELIAGLQRTRLLADWFHMNIEEADMAESLRQAGSAVGHIHFADTNRRAVGFGHLQVGPLIAALRDVGYTGFLSAEVFAWPDSKTAAEQTIAAYRRWVDAS